MGKTYRPYLPEQELLLPPSLRDWLPESHLVYFVSDVVDQLDLSTIENVYEKEQRGQPPYHPRLLVKLLVYGYCLGVRSSRKDRPAASRGRAFSGAGGRQPARLPHDFRLPQDPPRSAGTTLPASLAAGAGSRSDEAGTGGAGRHEDESQRFQAQAMSWGRMK